LQNKEFSGKPQSQKQKMNRRVKIETIPWEENSSFVAIKSAITLTNKIGYILLIFIALIACEKDKDDFRDKYTGNFEFTVAIEQWVYGQPTVYDTITYQGKVWKYKDEDGAGTLYTSNDTVTNPAKSITIEFMKDGIIVAELTEEGKFIEKSGYHYHHKGSYLSPDKMEFVVEGLGGLGQGVNYEIIGKR